MKMKGMLARVAVGAVGGLVLIGAAGAAFADEVGTGEVDVNVDIEAIEPVGALTMSVASGATSLSEVTSADPEVREFTGTLPNVTVTDDREDVPDGVFWYVTGQSSALSATGVADITADHLGWVPQLVTPGDGEVAEGPEVGTSLDEAPNNVGLVGEELLALALDSSEARPVGTWTANAGLVLKTPVTVAPGSYSGTLTLTLWEDAY